MIQIFFVSYNKTSFKNVHMEVDGYKLSGVQYIIKIIFIFYRNEIFHEISKQ